MIDIQTKKCDFLKGSIWYVIFHSSWMHAWWQMIYGEWEAAGNESMYESGINTFEWQIIVHFIYLFRIRIRIRILFIAKYVYPYKEFFLVWCCKKQTLNKHSAKTAFFQILWNVIMQITQVTCYEQYIKLCTNLNKRYTEKTHWIKMFHRNKILKWQLKSLEF